MRYFGLFLRERQTSFRHELLYEGEQYVFYCLLVSCRHDEIISVSDKIDFGDNPFALAIWIYVIRLYSF